MYILLFSLFLVYVFVMAIWGFLDIKKIKNKIPAEINKVKNYKEGIIIGWIPVMVFIPICLYLNISLNDLGFRLIKFNYNIWFTLITLVIFGSFLVITLFQMISYLISEKKRDEIRNQLLKPDQKNHYNDIMADIAIPRTFKEKKYFFGVALTAGICEEIIFRGLLLLILQALFPNLSILFIIIIACVIFGIGHLYQGVTGIIKTTIGGAVFCCLYIVTNSLIIGIIGHYLMDFSSAFLLREEKTKEN